MATSGSAPGGDIFDVRKIRRLVELMNEHDLHEIDLKQSDQRIRIRRGAEPIVSSGFVPMAAPLSAPVTPASVGTSQGAAKVDEASAVYIKSQMVGTFYSSPNPDSPPFVKVGDTVGPDTTVCIIEAMKVFNEIAAECSGKIIACLVTSGDPVEYNQPLFKVETAS